jgi:hypothetical protein
MHALELLCAGCVEYLPAAQSMHATLVPELYVPESQETQSYLDEEPAADTLLPTPHVMHASELTCAACVEYLPALQPMHATSALELYEPATHATQAPDDEEPAEVVLVPGSHVIHTEELDCATCVEYLPTTQPMHAISVPEL